MGTEPLSASRVQQEAMAALSGAITKVSHRLRNRAEAARDFTQLTSRAKAISANAWQLQTSRWGVIENAEKLASDLSGFAQDVAAASARATQEAEGSVAVVEALAVQASRLQALGLGGKEGGAGSTDTLKPLQATLVALQAKMSGASSASDDATKLAARATDLAACALHLNGGGREVEEIAGRINKALKAFAEAATSIADRLADAPASQGSLATQTAFRVMEAELASLTRKLPPTGGAPQKGPIGQPQAIGWR